MNKKENKKTYLSFLLSIETLTFPSMIRRYRLFCFGSVALISRNIAFLFIISFSKFATRSSFVTPFFSSLFRECKELKYIYNAKKNYRQTEIMVCLLRKYRWICYSLFRHSYKYFNGYVSNIIWWLCKKLLLYLEPCSDIALS